MNESDKLHHHANFISDGLGRYLLCLAICICTVFIFCKTIMIPLVFHDSNTRASLDIRKNSASLGMSKVIEDANVRSEASLMLLCDISLGNGANAILPFPGFLSEWKMLDITHKTNTESIGFGLALDRSFLFSDKRKFVRINVFHFPIYPVDNEFFDVFADHFLARAADPQVDLETSKSFSSVIADAFSPDIPPPVKRGNIDVERLSYRILRIRACWGFPMSTHSGVAGLDDHVTDVRKKIHEFRARDARLRRRHSLSADPGTLNIEPFLFPADAPVNPALSACGVGATRAREVINSSVPPDRRLAAYAYAFGVKKTVRAIQIAEMLRPEVEDPNGYWRARATEAELPEKAVNLILQADDGPAKLENLIVAKLTRANPPFKSAAATRDPARARWSAKDILAWQEMEDRLVEGAYGSFGFEDFIRMNEKTEKEYLFHSVNPFSVDSLAPIMESVGLTPKHFGMAVDSYVLNVHQGIIVVEGVIASQAAPYPNQTAIVRLQEQFYSYIKEIERLGRAEDAKTAEETAASAKTPSALLPQK